MPWTRFLRQFLQSEGHEQLPPGPNVERRIIFVARQTRGAGAERRAWGVVP
jgi:hypothetical protein